MASTSTPPSTGSNFSIANPLTVNNEPILSNQVFVVINVATQAPIKLTKTSFFLWKKQFDFFIGYDLNRFIDGSIMCHSPIFQDKSLNPDHLYWDKQD